MKIFHIFDQKKYIVYSVGVTVCILIMIPLFVNGNFVIDLIRNNTFTLGEKILILISIPYGYLFEGNKEPIMLFIFAVLSGVNFSGIMYYYSRNGAQRVSVLSALGSGSVLSAFVGLGCLSCGSFVVAVIASILGVSSLTLFPYNGLEFGVISIGMVCISLYILNRKLS